VITVPTRRIKPRRFDIVLELRGVTWRRIQFEFSPDEAGVGREFCKRARVRSRPSSSSNARLRSS
jgi:hypothetical protein